MKLLDKINSPKDLKKMSSGSLTSLCGEIRQFLVESVSKTGGHLASNLGVVELTVALHYCFNSPKDKIIWDVGHQAYVHKILTGRKNEFHKLRQLDGLSGFPKAKESPHDAFDTGHSSTSISAGLGYVATRDLSGKKNKVISVIGDGSMTGGLALEALNNAGRLNTDFLIVLNDNQMSISENVGGLSKYLTEIRTAPAYLGAKEDVSEFLKKVPVVGEKIGKVIERAKDGIKYLLLPGTWFEEIGLKYVGPVDGHNVQEMIDVLNKVKNMSGPVLLHVYTVKGKGYSAAELQPSKFHGVDSFDIETGKPHQIKIWDTYSDVFGKALTKIAETNDKVLAITAAMPLGTGLAPFEAAYPNRIFDVGIAEGHAVTFAAGMAKNGYIPVFAVYSTFLQRAYDQIMHDVCIQNLHVVFAIDRAGIVGADGETHQGLFDVSFLSHMPNMTFIAPVNKQELIGSLEFAVNHNGPIAIRYPRGAASRVLKDECLPFELGKSQTIHEGTKIAIVALGNMMDTAFEVYTMLCEHGFTPTLINPRFVKPIDLDMVHSLEDFEYVAVLEDNILEGGFGSKILENSNDARNIHRFAFPDGFVEQGERNEILEKYELDTNSIFKKIMLSFSSNESE